MTVAIVTDSTASIPQTIASALGITVVPVQVILNSVAYQEFIEIEVDDVIKALRTGEQVTTSRPNPQSFADVYHMLAEQGHTGIVSVHISSALSGTYESAVLASKSSAIPVHVIDSGGVAMMFGFAAMAGAQAAANGRSASEVVQIIQQACQDARLEFYVDTLEFLQRNGRISHLRSRIGTALAVKPILHMVDGRIELHERVRTSSRAIDRLVALVTEHADSSYQIAVHHVDAADRANTIAQRLCERLGIASVTVTPVGAVVAAHVGPGAVAVVVSR